MFAGFLLSIMQLEKIITYIVNQRKAYQLTQNKNNIYYMYIYSEINNKTICYENQVYNSISTLLLLLVD
jgi:hypothetical protein